MGMSQMPSGRTVTMTVSQKTQPDARKKKTWYMLSDESSLPMAPGCHGTDFTCTIRCGLAGKQSSSRLAEPGGGCVTVLSRGMCMCVCKRVR